MAASGGRGASCQLVQEMMRIPASNILQWIRMELSKILDPVKDLRDRDYRAFADRNGLTPRDWQWLDSQKVPGETSSICKVLDYLIAKHGASFTVFNVYQTLVDMDSEGQNVILCGMRDIRRMYNSDTRPGQEHTEPPSLASLLPHSLDHNRPKSPPPTYTDAAGSHCVEGESGGYQQNNLGAGCRPVKISDVVPAGQARRVHHQVRREMNCAHVGWQGDSNRPAACEVSFASNREIENQSGSQARTQSQSGENRQGRENSCMIQPSPVLNLSPGEPGEDSCSFNNSSTVHTTCDSGTLSPPSYNESQFQHMMTAPKTQPTMHHPALNMNLRQPAGPSPTDMEELKLPLQGPVVEARQSLCTNGTNMLSSPERQSGPNYRLGESTLYSQYGENTSVKQPIQTMNIPPDSQPGRGTAQMESRSCPLSQQDYRASYPSHRCPSYKSSDSVTHRNMDGHFCMHSGACNCQAASNYGQYSFFPPTHASPQTEGREISGRKSQTGSTSVSSSWPTGVSGSTRPWNDALHQTDAKQPLEPSSQGGRGSWKSRHHSMPQRENTLPQPIQRQSSMPPMNDSRKKHPEWNGVSKFIFILAADMEQSERVQKQVRDLSNELRKQRIQHIAVTSASQQPMVIMSRRRIQPCDGDFVADCFKKATIVLMMVSPGYLRYADAYTEGARKAESDQQELIRKFHEQLKEEFFETPTSRVWPVLHLNANRAHLPSFLSEGIYYFYPPQRDSENLFVLLKKFLSKVVHGC